MFVYQRVNQEWDVWAFLIGHIQGLGYKVIYLLVPRDEYISCGYSPTMSCGITQ